MPLSVLEKSRLGPRSLEVHQIRLFGYSGLPLVQGQPTPYEELSRYSGEPMTLQAYLDPTQEQGIAFFGRGILGSVTMLNLLRFRALADYSATPMLAPEAPISGEAAYRRYMEHTLPYLKASGGEVVFYGRGGNFLIGPTEERWDAAMLVRQASVATFLAFASNQGYLAGIGHRTAALEDSRLLPLVSDSL